MPLYTTRLEVEKRLSVLGVDLRTDDWIPSGTVIDAAIEDASVEIDGYLLYLFSAASLASSPWIKKKATDLALCYLCGRRGNPIPQSIKERCELAREQLEQVANGQMVIAELAFRDVAVPTLTNQRVRLRPVPQVVNVPGRSTLPERREGYTPHDDRSDGINYSI